VEKTNAKKIDLTPAMIPNNKDPSLVYYTGEKTRKVCGDFQIGAIERLSLDRYRTEKAGAGPFL
jgi:predicted transcriptional regulator